MRRYPKVSIILLSWNGWEDTVECLESLYQITYPNYDVILVDNASEDDSIARIKKWARGELKVESKIFEYNPYNKPIEVVKYERVKVEGSGNAEKEENFFKLPSNKKLRIIKNEKNYGFAEGNNIGMQYALKALNPDYVFVLNNDTVVGASALTELINVAESDVKIGAVQPKILRKDSSTVIDSFGQEILPSGKARDIGIGKYDNDMIKTPVEVFGVCAAAALYRSKALKEVGLFDKSFFTILEDVDLSWRIRLSGYKALLVPTAKVFHKRGISGRKQNSKRLAMLKTYYGSKNRVCLVLKYYPTGLILKFFALLCCRFFRASTCSMGIKDNLITDVFRCLKQRKTIHHKYPNIKEIQDKWIRRSPIGI